MLFLTILFLALTLATLVKGRLLYQLTIDMGEESVKQQTIPNHKPNKELVSRVIVFIILAMVYLLVYIIYLTNAISLDPLKYPSLIMLLWYLVNFMVNYKKGRVKPDFTNPEVLSKYRKELYKKRTLKGTVFNVIALAYFVYMTYVIVF